MLPPPSLDRKLLYISKPSMPANVFLCVCVCVHTHHRVLNRVGVKKLTNDLLWLNSCSRVLLFESWRHSEKEDRGSLWLRVGCVCLWQLSSRCNYLSLLYKWRWNIICNVIWAVFKIPVIGPISKMAGCHVLGSVIVAYRIWLVNLEQVPLMRHWVKSNRIEQDFSFSL